MICVKIVLCRIEVRIPLKSKVFVKFFAIFLMPILKEHKCLLFWRLPQEIGQ